jgi:hypothetical protein
MHFNGTKQKRRSEECGRTFSIAIATNEDPMNLLQSAEHPPATFEPNWIKTYRKTLSLIYERDTSPASAIENKGNRTSGNKAVTET